MGDIAAESHATAPLYVDVPALSRTFGIAIDTLRHWTSNGVLTPERGLRRAGRKVLIEVAVFKAALDRGEFADARS